MAGFEKIKNLKRYEIVIKQLKNKIASGELKPGDYLPTERELAEMMAVSRSSVREALKVLEFMGLIDSKPKDGTCIASIHSDLLMEKFNAAFEQENDKLLHDLLEMRKAIEPRIMELAISRASDQELIDIEDSIKALYDSEDETLNAQADTLFHLAIARTSRNVFLINLVESMMDMLAEIRSKSFSVSPSRRHAVIREHQQVLDAIKQRNEQAAVEAINQHLDNISYVIEKMV